MPRAVGFVSRLFPQSHCGGANRVSFAATRPVNFAQVCALRNIRRRRRLGETRCARTTAIRRWVADRPGVSLDLGGAADRLTRQEGVGEDVARSDACQVYLAPQRFDEVRCAA